MSKISVIIPVYNVEKYIEQCINSLLNQTLKDCEFIFVNDGSKDSSKEIIEKYKALDDRIILINQENQGVSIARNNGLKVAKGEYLGFVDADDYIEPDMYETLYNAAIEDCCDVVLSNWKHEISGNFITKNYKFPKNTLLDRTFINNIILPYFLEEEDLNTACNKLYKNQIIKENNIQFPERVALGEDGVFNMRVFCNAKSLKYIDYAGYYYREVEGSATRNLLNKDYFKRALEVYKTDLKTICNINIDYKTEDKLKSMKLITSVISYIYIYFTSKDISLRYKYRYVNNMIKNKDVQSALDIYITERYGKLSRYEKFVVNMIRRESTTGLYLASTYSKFRNKK